MSEDRDVVTDLEFAANAAALAFAYGPAAAYVETAITTVARAITSATHAARSAAIAAACGKIVAAGAPTVVFAWTTEAAAAAADLAAKTEAAHVAAAAFETKINVVAAQMDAAVVDARLALDNFLATSGFPVVAARAAEAALTAPEEPAEKA